MSQSQSSSKQHSSMAWLQGCTLTYLNETLKLYLVRFENKPYFEIIKILHASKDKDK